MLHREDADDPYVASRPGYPFAFAIRFAVAVLVGIGAFTFGAVAYLAILYDASSGCEDYEIACRTADPLVAGIEAALALVALGCLGAGAVALINGGSARRITAGLGAGMLVAGVWFGIALTTGP